MEITTIESFLAYYDRVRHRTRRVIACIPRDKIDWTYRDGKFSLADLVRHLGAIERYLFTEVALGRPSSYPGHGPELARGYDDVMAYFDRTTAESRALLSSMRDSDLAGRCDTPLGTPISVWKWLRSMLEHEIHHRGQIYLYLAMLEVETPPLYGLTEEDLRERSSDRG
jgi:uncharacterized damage-inducible protein DinB